MVGAESANVYIKFAGSSNGRTGTFEVSNLGSIPSPAAKKSRSYFFSREEVLGALRLGIETRLSIFCECNETKYPIAGTEAVSFDKRNRGPSPAAK